MMTVVIESDHVMYVLLCVKCVIWLVLSSTYHFLTDDAVQSAENDQQEGRAVAEKLPLG